MKYLVLLFLIANTVFCEHALYQIKRRGELVYLDSSTGSKRIIASKVNKFKIMYPLIAYTDPKNGLHALNLLNGQEIDLGRVKKFHLAQDLVAFTNSEETLYSYDFTNKSTQIHDQTVRKFKASKRSVVWVNRQRSLMSYVSSTKQTKLIEKNCDFFQLAWPMLSYVDLGYQLHGANLKTNKKRIIASSFYKFQASNSGILALDRSYTLRYYNTNLKRVTLVNDIERVRDFKFVDHYILYKQYDTKNLIFRNLRSPESVTKAYRPKAYQLAPHTLTIIDREGGLKIENNDYDMAGRNVIKNVLRKSKYDRLLTGNSIISYSLNKKVYLYNPKVGKEYKLGASVYWMELQGMTQLRPLKNLQRENFDKVYLK
ncbi:MAG: hypothetical protein KC646_09525 [Candidatus Cloacimonetes bacterium]|nr:hypothetical protein [Candidatus Cloacimonadota bacterium]